MDAVIVGKDGKWHSSKSAMLDASGDVVAKGGHKRYRATAVVIRDGKVLLVRDRGRHDFSLPGGGFKRGESTVQAGAREVYEELGLKTLSAERLRRCDLVGRRAKHKVCLLEVSGEPYLKSREIDRFVWWGMEEELLIQGHVRYILGKLGDRIKDLEVS